MNKSLWVSQTSHDNEYLETERNADEDVLQ